MIPKNGYRFPACAKPGQLFVRSFDASAGEGRSERIMPRQNAKRNGDSTKAISPRSGTTAAFRGSKRRRAMTGRRERGPMAFRFHEICAAVMVAAIAPVAALAQGYQGYPYTIMTPDRGAAID